ncbi:hypothetical protein ACOKGD_10665 [Microbacterium phosphatis]|uniref:hypothetical protein n=1 Tax=Microbacterium phosphatis TaxID=3140248 RepID=UPI0031404750
MTDPNDESSRPIEPLDRAPAPLPASEVPAHGESETPPADAAPRARPGLSKAALTWIAVAAAVVVVTAVVVLLVVFTRTA